MDLLRKIAVCMLILCLLSLVQGAVSAEAGSQESAVPRFRDDNVARGIDHSKPNVYLVYDLQKKLVAAKGELLGLPEGEIDAAVAGITPPSGWKPAVGSKGTQKILVFVVDFPDYHHGASQTVADVNSKMNGPGDAANYPTDNMNDFYARSSYNQLNLDMYCYGWYRAQHNRDYYGGSVPNRWKLFSEVLTAYDNDINYADFDNDHDGDIDNIWIIWTGPDDTWDVAWWWPQHWSFSWDGTPPKWDGVYPVDYAWEWYTSPWTTSGLFDSNTPCHEMGHVLGLPDYYDYNGTYGPDGGLGGFDMMDGNWPDHNTFSKYLLGWVQPIVIGDNPHDTSGGLYPVGDSQSQNSVLIMPGATMDNWGEFFLAENRAPGYGNDPAWYWSWDSATGWHHEPWTERGLVVWHVDATVDPSTHWFRYDNSWTSHKLLRLMEADGEEDIENNRGWDPADTYAPDQFFGPTTTPSSNNYAGGSTQVHIQDLSLSGNGVTWARYMIGEYPPTVTGMTPGSGTQNTLLSVYNLAGTNFWSHPGPVVYFWYKKKIGTYYIWLQESATNVTVVNRNKITCTFDLTGIPEGSYTVYVENPDGEYGSLANALTVTPPWVHVIVPNGGEQWAAGTTHEITWAQAGLTGTNVRIDLWKDWPVGVHQRLIAASVPAEDGSFFWHIPEDVVPSAYYWVNISSISNPAINDYTDGWLGITAVPVAGLTVKKYISRDNVNWKDGSIIVPSGSTVYYNVTVKNTGTATLTSVYIEDDGSYATYSMLAPGGIWNLYYSETAGKTTHTNTANAAGTSSSGNTPVVSDTATYYPVIPLPGYTNPPTDPDGDGIYEDLNANGRLDFADVVLYFNYMDWIAANEPIPAFDLNDNGRIDFADIVALFNEI